MVQAKKIYALSKKDHNIDLTKIKLDQKDRLRMVLQFLCFLEEFDACAFDNSQQTETLHFVPLYKFLLPALSTTNHL